MENEEQLVASEELIDKIAKNIFKADLASDQFFSIKFHELSKEDFTKRFNKATDITWLGAPDIDESERRRYRLLAIVALHTLGYKVEIPDQATKAVLV